MLAFMQSDGKQKFALNLIISTTINNKQTVIFNQANMCLCDRRSKAITCCLWSDEDTTELCKNNEGINGAFPHLLTRVFPCQFLLFVITV